jgi:CubicO group peptidase (beta-lactamase class C family)
MEKIFAMDLVYPRNSQIVYSDIGYILLGKIIEKITGVPLDRYAKEILFTPLEMFDTTYNPGDKKRCAPTEERKDRIVQGILRGEVHDEKSYILGGVAGHAGLFSTVTDVAHFIDMILNKGVYKGRRIFSEAVIDLLFAPKVEISHPLIKNYDRRGIGWIIQSCYSSAGDLVSEETILHTGFTGTNIWIDRRNEIGFCLLTNRVHPTRENLKIITVRPKLANFIMAHLDEFKKEDL